MSPNRNSENHINDKVQHFIDMIKAAIFRSPPSARSNQRQASLVCLRCTQSSGIFPEIVKRAAGSDKVGDVITKRWSLALIVWWSRDQIERRDTENGDILFPIRVGPFVRLFNGRSSRVLILTSRARPYGDVRAAPAPTALDARLARHGGRRWVNTKSRSRSLRHIVTTH